MIRRFLAALAASALMLAPVVPTAADSPSQGQSSGSPTVNASISGTYPAATPSLAPGARNGLTIDQQGNLNVHVQAGGGSGGGAVYPAPSASPFPVSGSVNVGNFPATQPISGSVNVGNFPATQPISVATSLPVNIVGGYAGGQYNTTLPTYTNGATVTPQYDQNGRTLNAPTTLNVPSPIPVIISNASPVPIAATSPLPIAAPGVTTSGTCNYTACYVGPVALSGASGYTVTVTGTWVGTIQWRYSDDGVTNNGANLLYPNGSATTSGNMSATVLTTHPWIYPYVLSYTSGTINISVTPFWGHGGEIASDSGIQAPIATPNPSGTGSQLGLNTNAQNLVNDGTNWFPMRGETTSGVPIVTFGGIYTYYMAGNTSAGAPIRIGSGRLVSIINTSTTAQTNPMGCYNGTSASGNPLWVGTLQASQVVTLNIFATTGIFCQATTGATNTGNGINFLYE